MLAGIKTNECGLCTSVNHVFDVCPLLVNPKLKKQNPGNIRYYKPQTTIYSTKDNAKKYLSSKKDKYILITTKDHANDQPARSCIYVLTVLALILKQKVQQKHITMEKMKSKGRTRNHKRSLRKVINDYP